MNRQTSWLHFFILAVCTTLWVACAGGQTSQAPPTADQLTQSGFQVRQADSPQKLAHLKSLFNNKFIHVHFGDQSVFAFPDHDSGRLYVGNEAAYQRYQGQTSPQTATKQNWDPQAWDMWELSQGGGP